MSHEPITITCRADFVRPGEKKYTKDQRHARYARNLRKRNAPDRCWECRHFTDCSCSEACGCEKWLELAEHYKEEE